MFLFVNSPYSKYLTYISQMRDAENYPLQETLQNMRLKVVMETFMLSFLTFLTFLPRACLSVSCPVVRDLRELPRVAVLPKHSLRNSAKLVF